MTYMEKQKAEMETIKPRAFFVDLSDADVKRIFSVLFRNKMKGLKKWNIFFL